MNDLFGSPKVPKPPDPTPIPDLFDPAVLAARRRTLENAAARSGRASTNLANQDQYGGTKLGTA